MNKCVFVIGPESSGSMLIGKICSHVLGIDGFGSWNGAGWSDRGGDKVCHRSLPFGIPPQFPDVEKWIEDNQADYELYFILTTRDITISELSRNHRWSKPASQARLESENAREIMVDVMNKHYPCFIWSYETFMFLKADYLKKLYQFLSVESDFIPDLVDTNANKIASSIPAP